MNVRRLSQRLSADGGDAFTYLDLDNDGGPTSYASLSTSAALPATSAPVTPQGEPATGSTPDGVIDLEADDPVELTARAAPAEVSAPAEIILDGPSADVLPRRRSQLLVDDEPGLPRRSPREQVRDLRSGGSALDAGTARVAGSQRTPEEVRRMLSRYRTGLQQGRRQVGDDGHADTSGSDSDDLRGEG